MIYVPEHFRVSDESTLHEFMRRHDFASVVSRGQEGLTASHVPVLVRSSATGLVLAGHVARANPHWRLMDGRTPTLVMFHGPHSYVSPTWYETAPAVPTWNFGVVHAEGFAMANSDPAFMRGVVEELARRYESAGPEGWRPERLPADYYRNMLRGIVGFEMPVARLDGKFKLGQNRSAEDRRRTIAALEREGSSEAGLAELMRLRAGV